MRTMTVTEGLVELKTLDKRINKARENVWVTCGKKKSDEVQGIKKADIEQAIKANYESILDLMENRAKIKSAIVKSNAETELTVGGERMTVAEAIERKTSIEYDKALLSRMATQYEFAKTQIDTQNHALEGSIEKMTQRLSESDKQNLATEQKALAEAYMKDNEWGFVDPLDISTKIKDLDEQIDNFEANVDTALSLSNAVTMIEV